MTTSVIGSSKHSATWAMIVRPTNARVPVRSPSSMLSNIHDHILRLYLEVAHEAQEKGFTAQDPEVFELA